MERKEIKQRVSQLQDKEALLQLLNDIVKDELSGDNVFSFSMKQLSYYCNPNNLRGRYSHFSIPKKSGGQRRISAPSRGISLQTMPWGLLRDGILWIMHRDI